MIGQWASAVVFEGGPFSSAGVHTVALSARASTQLEAPSCASACEFAAGGTPSPETAALTVQFLVEPRAAAAILS